MNCQLPPRFTSEIVSGKDFPAGEFDSAKPEDDPEYELTPPNEDPFAVGAPDPRDELYKIGLPGKSIL